ncbi:MAG TPA: hypothetical protein VNX01_02595 [Bacteroidia bacterium]|nr:hypothetical protein [Bacteroidia bacterium]
MSEINSSNKNNENDMKDLKKESLVLQANITAINTRFNDLYVLGALIITLMLAVTVSVYLKTETEVDKHMKAKTKEIDDEINKNKTTMDEHMKEMLKILGDARANGIAIAAIEKINNEQPHRQS